MYGMVNEAVRNFIEKEHDTKTWHDICARADIEETSFERMSSYDDAVTYKLVGAICEHTDLPAAHVLEVFGTHFVSFAWESSFGNLMRLSGATFVERVRGLDDLHERILMSMPNLRPPSFEIEEVGEDEYDLFYYSEREGLAPMVLGLLKGLAEDTQETISVAHTQAKAKISDPDIFRVKVGA